MNYTSWGGTALVLLGMLSAAPASAQKMYRCGSSYQDHACDNVATGKEVRNFGSAPTAVALPVSDGQCRQRGVDAQKVVWARQSGALPEKLIADLPRGDSFSAAEQKRLITDVYNKPRGSALEVGASIEADCIEAKKQAALTAALLAASLKSSGRDMAVASPGGQSAGETRTIGSASGSGASTTDATTKKAICSSFNERVLAIQASQRAGGNAAAMDSLNRQKIGVDAERSRAGC